MLVLLALLVAGITSLSWYYLHSSKSVVQGRAPNTAMGAGGKLTLLVSSDGGISASVLSPDGKMLAYVSDDQGQPDLFVSRVAGGERVRLTNDRAEESMPDFSPDGEKILYTRSGSGETGPEIWVVPTLGGQSIRVLADAWDGKWSPDGKRLAFAYRRPGEGNLLAVSSANGTDISVLMKSDGTYPFLRTPSWSPDGKLLAVTRSTGGSAGELWLVALDGSSPHRLRSDPPGVFSNRPIFTPDGRGIVHVSNRSGATNLWILPMDGGPPARLTSGPGPDTMPTLSRSGLIAFVNERSRHVLRIVDLAGGESRDLLSHSWYIWAPAYSPSGNELAFSRAEQDGSWHIWVVPVQGGAALQLTSGELPEIYPRWTPDGAFVIYNTWSSGPDRVWKVPRGGGPPVALTPERDDDDQYADISPDGKRIAFARTENRATRIYVAALDGGRAFRLTETPSTLPRWSPDGQWIAFSPSRGYLDGLFLIKPDGTGLRQVSQTGGWPMWWRGGRQLGCQTLGKDGSTDICTVPVTGALARALLLLRIQGDNHPFDLSPDGKQIAVGTGVGISSDIWLLEPQP